jgi:hypothetical protein
VYSVCGAPSKLSRLSRKGGAFQKHDKEMSLSLSRAATQIKQKGIKARGKSRQFFIV